MTSVTADPHRNLEDVDSRETVGWWRAQNERTADLLAGAADVRRRVIEWRREMQDYTRDTIPSRRGSRAFFHRQRGLDPQAVFCVEEGGEVRVLIDPIEFAADGTVALGPCVASPDGEIVAYTVSEAGSDWQTMRFRDVASGADVHGELTGLRFTGATWDPDSRGFSYSRPAEGASGPGDMRFAAWHHELTTDPADDTLLHERPDIATSFVSPMRLHRDDAWLFLATSVGTDHRAGMQVRVPGEPPVVLLDPLVASLFPFHREGRTVLAWTDLDAPRGRVVRIRLDDPTPDGWQTLVEEPEDPGTRIDWADALRGRMLLCVTEQGADRLEVRELDGSSPQRVELPDAVKVEPGPTHPEDRTVEVSVGGFLSPDDRFEVDVQTATATFLRSSDIPRDLIDVAVVERLVADSDDGTEVPLWVVRRRDVPLDGRAPAILYGYGGFRISLEPWFSYEGARWVEAGGVWAVANIRGGGELGADWYEQGRVLRKQNSFDDFAACARTLVGRGYTSPDRLALQGGSNGGLLVAAVSQQHPDLRAAVVSQVPVTDMARFHTDNYGAAWISDYGDPDDPEEHASAMAWSPLHTVAPADSVTYPATLVLTGDHDDRVAPWHAFKWVAARLEAGHEKTWLRVDERAGHGAGKPTEQQIEESADIASFLHLTLARD